MAAATPASVAPSPTPTSKNAVKVPIAAPRRDSGTRLTTSSASDGRSIENAAPIASAPAIATGSDSASMIATRPEDSTMPAPMMQGTGP